MHLLRDFFLQPDLLTILYAVYTDEVLQPEKKIKAFYQPIGSQILDAVPKLTSILKWSCKIILSPLQYSQMFTIHS